MEFPLIRLVSGYDSVAWKRYYHPQRSWGKGIFSEACVKNSVHLGEGACMQGGMHGRGVCGRGVCEAGGMHGRGHAWQGACMAGGACVVRGTCVAGGVHWHAWQGGMHGRGHAWQGVCV